MRLLVVIAAAAAIPQPQKLRPLRLGGGGDAPKEIDAITLPDGNATSVAHTWSPAEALSKMHARLEEGLTGAEAARRRTLFGPNALVAPPRKGRWAMLLDQFDDRLVQILVAVAVVSGVLGVVDADEPTAWVDPLVIVLILASNAAVGVWQESSAEGALDALRKLQPEKCCVRRAGAWDGDVDAADLAPGDVVYLRVGDKVPADVRLLQLRTSAFAVDEAALTGESETIQKSVGALDDGDAPLAARVNLCFAGTVVTAGHAVGVVVATGMATQIGRIQAGVTAAAEDREKTPLAKKLDEFGKQLTTIIGGVCVATFCASIPRFNSPVFGGSWARGATHYAKGAVALGVAAIPEGLPAVITLCLSLGTRRMAARRVVVRRLPSVETLGCTSVICSDKTGTLTTNQMTATALLLPAAEGFRELAVSGLSYDPQDGAVEGSADWCNEDRAAHEAAAVCSLCNDAQLARDSETGQFARVGEPTEAALRVLAEKLGAPAAHVDREIAAAGPWHRASLAWAAGFARVATLEFDRGRKSMSTLCRSDGAAKLYVKGAPDSVIRRCDSVLRPDGSVIPLTAAARADLLARVTAMASRPLRCLALATRADLPGPAAEYRGGDADFLDGAANHEALESSLTLCGVVGIRDPPRPEAKEAMRKCKAAGVRVFMITGDSRETAAAIGGELGILEDAARTWEGNDFFSDRLDDAQRAALLHPDRGNGVFCRTAPADKQRIIKLLAEAHGDVTAMTGDGVNDAPALKQAAIGVAMGVAGTEVAKEASDMILADDNFATIVAAVEEGRSIYSNMKAFIRYLISSNIGEVASIFLTALLGLPEGLIPVQLLWVNLVTDGPPATALGFNPPDADIMRKPPRRADDELITPWVFFRYMVVGLYVGLATVGVFVYWYVAYDWSGYGQPLVTFEQLANWGKCPAFADMGLDYAPDFSAWAATPNGLDLSADPCAYFSKGKLTASTLSLSVLVVIEMLNALNALSEDGSLLQMPPWANPYLLLAMAVSIGLHFVILYIPQFAAIFSIVPLTYEDWVLVVAFSSPVILIDEVLKLFGRRYQARALAARLAEAKRA